jgi:integrase
LSSSTLVAPACERLAQLRDRLDLDLDLDAGVRARSACAMTWRDAAGRRDVVFLDQDAVPQREPLVAAAADAHRVLLRPGAGRAASFVYRAPRNRGGWWPRLRSRRRGGA